MAILGQATPLVEQISIDEAFLDVSDLPESGLEIAACCNRAGGFARHPFAVFVGDRHQQAGGENGHRYGKASRRGLGAYPNAIFEVAPGQEAAFLNPLPVDTLWGIGPKSTARLAGLGIHTVGEIAALPIVPCVPYLAARALSWANARAAWMTAR